jgi:hypothetical protein
MSASQESSEETEPVTYSQIATLPFQYTAVYISARKKLIHAMSLDTDRPINRAVVVGCAISATRNYLKLHMSRTLKVLLCNTHAETRKLWKCSARLASRSNARRSIHQPPVAALHAPAEMPTALSSVPRYAEIHLVSCSRRAHHRERRRHATLIALVALPGATLPATSCLGAFWTRPVERAALSLLPASKNQHTSGLISIEDSYLGLQSTTPF